MSSWPGRPDPPRAGALRGKTGRGPKGAAGSQERADNALTRLARAEALFKLGRDEEALLDLNEYLDNPTRLTQALQVLMRGKNAEDLTPVYTQFADWGYKLYKYSTVAKARRGDLEKARKVLAVYADQLALTASIGGITDWKGMYLDGIVSAYVGDNVAGMKRVEAALARDPRNSLTTYAGTCAYAVAAHALEHELKDRVKAMAAADGLPLGGLVAAPPGLPLSWIMEQQQGRAKGYTDRALALLEQAVANGYTDFRNMQSDDDLEGLADLPRFRALLARVHLERRYSAVWHNNAELVSEESHGLDPAAHLARCRQLAADGYRPVSLAVASVGGSRPVVTASVWQRTLASESAREALALRQANAAVALLQLGHAGRVWPLLHHSTDPRVRTYLVHSMGPLNTEPHLLLQRLQSEPDASARRALILSLGEYTAEQLPEADRREVVDQLLHWYRDDPDAGVHGAVDWLLRHGRLGDAPRKLDWGQKEAIRRIDKDLAGRPADGPRRWYVNSQGQTLTILPGPVDYLMGSPAQEADRFTSETLHRQSVGRSLAIASKETTVAQFQEFLKAHPEVRHTHVKKFSPDDDGPIIGATWYEAVEYCRWLSDKEGVPEEQMCYPPIAEIEKTRPKSTGRIFLPADYLSRTGYRLPSEAEWEYACRAGAETSRFFGNSDKMLAHYAWYESNSHERAWPVGEKKPNDFGLFDLYGNAAEWCEETNLSYRIQPGGQATTDAEDATGVWSLLSRTVRGGAYLRPPKFQRSAVRFADVPTKQNDVMGFRLARTVR